MIATKYQRLCVPVFDVKKHDWIDLNTAVCRVSETSKMAAWTGSRYEITYISACTHDSNKMTTVCITYVFDVKQHDWTVIDNWTGSKFMVNLLISFIHSKVHIRLYLFAFIQSYIVLKGRPCRLGLDDALVLASRVLGLNLVNLGLLNCTETYGY